MIYCNFSKKILSGVFALALLATAGYGVDKNMNSDADLNDLALANVEALANGESGSSTCVKRDNFEIKGKFQSSPCP